MQTIVDDILNIDCTSDLSEFELPFKCEFSILQEENCWQGTLMPDRSTLNRIVAASLSHILSELDLDAPPASPGIEISFLFSDDTHIQILNKEYRGKNQPTNVLSFPQTELSTQNLQETLLFQEPLLLGDIALAEETIKREATEQNKPFRNHLIHLIVHGVLHLVGYDHIEEDEAELMESLEIEILKKFDINNPYTIALDEQEASQSKK